LVWFVGRVQTTVNTKNTGDLKKVLKI